MGFINLSQDKQEEEYIGREALQLSVAINVSLDRKAIITTKIYLCWFLIFAHLIPQSSHLLFREATLSC